jgi:hypothetical protein
VNGILPKMRVIGVSGTFVGTVREVGEGKFLVAPADPGDLPYWLKSEAVIGVDGNRVELICSATEVHRYLADAPQD